MHDKSEKNEQTMFPNDVGEGSLIKLHGVNRNQGPSSSLRTRNLVTEKQMHKQLGPKNLQYALSLPLLRCP